MGEIVEGFFVEGDPELIVKLELLGAGVREGETLKLPLIEAAYFQEKGAIDTGKGIDELLELAGELGKEKFAVLKELRDAGYIVRLGEGSSDLIRVYRKGIRVGEDRTESVLKVLAEGEKPDLLEDLAGAAKLRKALHYAFVSPEGEIVFVKAYRAGFD